MGASASTQVSYGGPACGPSSPYRYLCGVDYRIPSRRRRRGRARSPERVHITGDIGVYLHPRGAQWWEEVPLQSQHRARRPRRPRSPSSSSSSSTPSVYDDGSRRLEHGPKQRKGRRSKRERRKSPRIEDFGVDAAAEAMRRVGLGKDSSRGRREVRGRLARPKRGARHAHQWQGGPGYPPPPMSRQAPWSTGGQGYPSTQAGPYPPQPQQQGPFAPPDQWHGGVGDGSQYDPRPRAQRERFGRRTADPRTAGQARSSRDQARGDGLGAEWQQPRQSRRQSRGVAFPPDAAPPPPPPPNSWHHPPGGGYPANAPWPPAAHGEPLASPMQGPADVADGDDGLYAADAGSSAAAAANGGRAERGRLRRNLRRQASVVTLSSDDGSEGERVNERRSAAGRRSRRNGSPRLDE